MIFESNNKKEKGKKKGFYNKTKFGDSILFFKSSIFSISYTCIFIHLFVDWLIGLFMCTEFPSFMCFFSFLRLKIFAAVTFDENNRSSRIGYVIRHYVFAYIDREGWTYFCSKGGGQIWFGSNKELQVGGGDVTDVLLTS
jgi:hypothetical protein